MFKPTAIIVATLNNKVRTHAILHVLLSWTNLGYVGDRHLDRNTLMKFRVHVFSLCLSNSTPVATLTVKM